MANILTRPATYEDLMKVPDHLVAEIVEGELHTSPRPSGPHVVKGLHTPSPGRLPRRSR
ncbi:MAG TPA: hypothetical protein VF432_10215 [Thermoanaerobaculia bacterium]